MCRTQRQELLPGNDGAGISLHHHDAKPGLQCYRGESSRLIRARATHR